MEFLRDLQEGRMIRDKTNARVLTYADCCERLYLSILIIELMRQTTFAKDFVKNYCKKTIVLDFNKFMVSGTDAHNFAYFVAGDEEALSKLKDPGSAKRARRTTNLNVRDLRAYFVSISSGNNIGVEQFLIRLENILNITNQDYKNIRRNLSTFAKKSKIEQKNIATRLLFAARAKLRSSDLIDDFSKFVAKFDLESNWVNDPEPTISKPDLSTKDPDYIYYRLLAKPENLLLVKGFLQLMSDGKPIPANMVKAYAPIAKVVDDIVKGGPSYINMLKSIQKRAKSSIN